MRKNAVIYSRTLIFSVLAILVALTAFVIPSSPSHAQIERPAALVLTDSFREQYLAPYLKKHEQAISEGNVDVILRSHQLEATSHFNNSAYRSSIIPLGFEGKPLWVSFEVLNKSASENWYLDLGHYFNGRFGLLRHIDVLVTNFNGDILYKESVSNKKSDSFIPLVLPADKRSIIAISITGNAGIPTTTPLKLTSIDTKSALEKARKSVQTYSLFGLIGMLFFFLSMCVSQSSPAYKFFAAYYIILCLMALLEGQLFFFIPVLSSIVLPTLLTLLAMASIIIVKIFWDEVEESEVLDTLFKTAIIVLIAIPITAFLLPNSMAMEKAIMFFFPSLFLLALIPILSLVQSQYGKQDAMPFVFGWFVFVCGLGISAIAISGFMPPLSTTLNAFWYGLLPQAIFFIYALRIKTNSEEIGIAHAKTMEIVENDNVNKFRQSKELAEQERLMKVIEQERKVLGELRKSEARRAEEMRIEKERADDANRAKSAFLAVVSHEIRTPMSGIMGMVKMLLDSSLDKKQKEYAQTIQDSSDAMLALLNDILDFEKVEQGKMEIENIGIDLPRLIQGVATLMNGHATQKGIKLVTNVDEKLPRYVKSDPTRLRQVLLNLTGNAIKFTEEGSVTITAKLIRKGSTSKPHEIYLGVTDSGVGISKEGQQKIFDAFSQADKSVSRKFGGTGLGLAISKGLVEAMGGNIGINSNEGEGSTFFFTLDMDDASREEETTTSAAPEIYEHHKKPMRILVVDDNDVNRKVITGFLEKSPHKLDTAKTAEDALTKVNINPYDLILMDIELPGINGDEATQKIRANSDKKIATTLIIALTGNVMEEDIKKYLEAGMNDTIAKPIKPETLHQTLDKAVTGAYKKKDEQALPKKPEEEKPEIFKNIQKEEIEKAPKPTLKIDNPPVEEEPIEKPPAPEKAPETPVKRVTRVSRVKKRITSQTNVTSDEKVEPLREIETNVSETSQRAFDNDILDTLKGHLAMEQITDMLDEVFDKSYEIIAALNEAFGKRDAQEIYAKAHELKGMTGNFGLVEMSEIAGNIEAAAKVDNLTDVDLSITQIPTALAKARAAAKEWLEN